MTPEAILSFNIRRFMLSRGFNCIKLSQCSGVPVKELKAILIEKTRPNMDTVRAIAGALCCQWYELLREPKTLKYIHFPYPQKDRDFIIADAAEQLADYEYLEGILEEDK